MSVELTTLVRSPAGTAAEWAAANPILPVGVMGIETDTRQVKFGDGITRWNSLAYLHVAASGEIATLDNLADGLNYKKIAADRATRLNSNTQAALWDYTKAVKLPPDYLTEMVEEASAGAATVKYDDLGFPSMMYIIRGPILAGHIHADMGGTVVGTDEHPAFKVNGVAKNEIYIAMFKGTSFNGTTFHGSGTGYRAVSWPGLMPTGSLDFDASKALHTAKGAGWHMMSMWEQGLVSWLSMKMNTEPRGNTYYGRSHESGYEYECAVRSDGLTPGYVGGTAKHRNGSGPSKWSHNGERWGIHDLVGSMWEWRDGFKEVDGLIYMPNDNYYGLSEASWPSQGVYLDNTIAGSGGTPRLSNARDNPLVDPNYSTVTHNALTLTAGYDTIDVAVRRRMLAAMIAPKIASGGTNPWSPKGILYNRNYGERLPFCGGNWSYESSAGLAALYLIYPRSSVSSSFGFRPAFLSP